jgi:hypothetical protein
VTIYFEALVAEDQQEDPGGEMLPGEVRAMFIQYTEQAAIRLLMMEKPTFAPE